MDHKICVSITSTDFNESLQVINCNRMVELRLDLMQISNEQVKQLLQHNVISVVTFREGKYSLATRQEALISAIDSGATFVDVEIEAEETYRQAIVQYAKQKGCKVIISYHNFEDTPDTRTLKSIISQSRDLGANIVKLVTTATSPTDSSRILSLYEDNHNLVAFAMGEAGKITRFACLYLGSPFTYASAEQGKEAAPSQLSRQDMEQMIRLMRPVSKKLFAVAGNPILHSRSPLLFYSAYADTPESYTYFRMAAESGEEVLQLFRELKLSGINITAPFKSDAAKLAAHCSDEASVLQAANTLVEKNGKLYAYNTDIYGVIGSLQANDINLKGKNSVILGAGGAGCAAAYALKNAGAQVTIVNRTEAKAKTFAEKIGCSYSGLAKLKELLEHADILINTLSANVDIVEEEWLNKQPAILDAVYHGSTLKHKAISKGCIYIDGSQWLMHQGIPAYRMFTGIEPNCNRMSDALAYPLQLPKHISFIGFMGTGKSTVAPLVAKMLDLPIVDIDCELESRYNETTPRMISSKGETYFREKEQMLLKEALSSEIPSVISCGGGVVTRPELRKQLKKESIVVCLYAPPNECLKRIDINSRPLLAKHNNPQAMANKLFEERKALYLQTAWLLVNTNGRSVEQVSKIVYDEISKCMPG